MTQAPTRALSVVACAALLGLAGCEGASPPSYAAQSPSKPSAQVTTPQRRAEQTVAVNSARRTAITSAAERVAPAVVTVQTEAVQRVAADPFEQLFGGRSAQRTQAGMGSGFVVRADGVIVTNAHVVAGASTVSVAMRDGTSSRWASAWK